VNRFLGIPYAAPPVGNLRWRPPQPVKRWKDTLDATKYANTCPQVTELGAFAGPTSTTEDCLYLNVFTTGGSSHSGKKPVFVWIHGGGNVDGESNDYDGSKLATGGPYGTDTVVVIMNYRMGLFGYLSHPALNSEGHPYGNYGILDIQAVLKWVQRNIEAFGGDPSRVLLGGQSAGAQDTAANMFSPAAKGLFNRALLQSSPTATLTPNSVALTRGNNFATAANCPGSNAASAACLRNLTAERILQLQGTPNANSPFVTGPHVDGTIIPLAPEEAWSTGKYNQMPVMGGNVQDEGNFSISITQYFSGPPQVPLTAAQVTTLVTNAYGGNAGPGGTPPAYPSGTVQAVLDHYPLGTDPQAVYNRISTDPGACRSLHVVKLWAQKVPSYMYQFNYRDAPYYFPQMKGFTPLAAHTIDIPFLFPNWHGGQLGVNLDQSTGFPRELNGPERELSHKLTAAWTNFAKTGNPNGSGDAPWARFTTSSQRLLSQNVPSLSMKSAADYAAYHQCGFWDTILVY
jgi:para-nitrobenzyl esterase